MELMFQLLEGDRIRMDVTRSMFGAQAPPNEIQKKLIPLCSRVSHNPFDRTYVLEAGAKRVETSDYDYL
jgi:hypothetical protein